MENLKEQNFERIQKEIDRLSAQINTGAEEAKEDQTAERGAQKSFDNIINTARHFQLLTLKLLILKKENKAGPELAKLITDSLAGPIE